MATTKQVMIFIVEGPTEEQPSPRFSAVSSQPARSNSRSCMAISRLSHITMSLRQQGDACGQHS